MKHLIILPLVLLLVGCSHVTQEPRFATIYGVHEDPVRVITDEEIALLPSALSLADVHSRFGRGMRCEIAIGFYPRFIEGVDYSEPLGERVIDSSFMFWPDIKSEGQLEIVARAEGSNVIIVWPAHLKGMKLEEYWSQK